MSDTATLQSVEQLAIDVWNNSGRSPMELRQLLIDSRRVSEYGAVALAVFTPGTLDFNFDILPWASVAEFNDLEDDDQLDLLTEDGGLLSQVEACLWDPNQTPLVLMHYPECGQATVVGLDVSPNINALTCPTVDYEAYQVFRSSLG